MSKQDTPFQVTVNEKERLAVLAAEAHSLDMTAAAAGQWHILHEGKAYSCEVIAADFAAKTFDLLVNGRRYTTRIEDRYDQLIERMGLASDIAHKVRDIRAPMPGLVLDIFAAPGQPVREGEKLLILEAMKMENVIKSPGDGVIKRIHVDKGAGVEKGQVMIELE